MTGPVRLVALAVLLAAGSACGRLHALAEYYPDGDSGTDTADDTGSDSADTDTGGDTDTGPVDTDTGPVDTDTGPIDTGGGSSTLCTDLCDFAYDGECDDGGPNSDWSLCALGSDCSDCGPREVSGGCSDACFYSMDGWCDDGGPNAETAWCDYATDCTDCGPR